MSNIHAKAPEKGKNKIDGMNTDRTSEFLRLEGYEEKTKGGSETLPHWIDGGSFFADR